jgi:hypothetical protein
MKYLIALLILLFFTLGRLTAQPRTLDDMIEFRGNKVYAKMTWTMRAKYWPPYTLHKGDLICEIEE